MESLDKSIQHWKNIKSGKEHLHATAQDCALCEEFQDSNHALNCCGKCPLNTRFSNCKRNSSPYSKYNRTLESILFRKDLPYCYHGEWQWKHTIKDLSEEYQKELLYAINRMINRLEALKVEIDKS